MFPAWRRVRDGTTTREETGWRCGIAPWYFVNLVHPDDAGWVEQRSLTHIRERREYTYLEYRLSRTDGAAVWVGATWRALRDERGGLMRFAGARDQRT